MIRITTDKEIINAIKFYEQAKAFNLALKNDLKSFKDFAPTRDEVLKYHLGNKYSLLSGIYSKIKS